MVNGWMPHGRLTPLGRQLRSVLAHISQPPNPCPTPFDPPRRYSHLQGPQNGSRQLHTTSVLQAQAVALAADDEKLPSPDNVLGISREGTSENGKRFRTHGWRRLKRRARIAHLEDALKGVQNDGAAPYEPFEKVDLTYVNVRKPSYWKKFPETQKWKKHQPTPNPKYSRQLSIQGITATYIRTKGHKSREPDVLEAEWEAQAKETDEKADKSETEYHLTEKEREFLHSKGVSMEDIEAWANILSAEDPLQAADLLAARVDGNGPESVPIFVYMQLLRREYISARALRTLIVSGSKLFAERARRLPDPNIDVQPITIVAIRMLRHAREVWPQSMSSIVEIVLKHIRYREQHGHVSANEQLANMTYILNKLMNVVSVSTAVRPFKDNPYQEAALVPILQFMSEHNPTLQVSRQGYRAVVRLQLTQKKTGKERQWAQLKAQSWPPWKVDRTAMDALIEPDDHGVSKAAATLARMRSAGYRPLAWEKTASLYAGWDVDRTPTTQMRALLDHPSALLRQRRRRTPFEPWVARIETTRTIQEAWAAYLAWEDTKLPHNQDVYLVILRKLLHEERRQDVDRDQKLKSRRDSSKAAWPLQPGDSRDVSPAPSSTHLWTYTRTPPPSVDEFYRTLLGRGVVFEGHCLAFLIENAGTLQSGVSRLRNSTSRYPEIHGLLSLDPSVDLSRLPTPILVAAAQLFARFANVPWSKTAPGYYPGGPPDLGRSGSVIIQPGSKLNSNNPVSRAIEVLRLRQAQHVPLWNAVLRGLTHEVNIPRLSYVLNSAIESESEWLKDPRARNNPKALLWAGALNAFFLVRRIFAMARERHLDLDEQSVYHLALATQNFVVATWAMMQRAESVRKQGDEAGGRFKTFGARFYGLATDTLDRFSPFYGMGNEAKATLRNTGNQERLKREFRILVGAGAERGTETDHSPILPPLLTIPGPAFLHAYIRALGWLADYNGLLETVRWMRDHESQLAARRVADRLGDDMMRKAIVALRVFLERTWMEGVSPLPTDGESGENNASPSRAIKLLSRLSSPADPELIDTVRDIVDEVESWEGWPTDDEVRRYTRDARFRQVRDV